MNYFKQSFDVYWGERWSVMPYGEDGYAVQVGVRHGPRGTWRRFGPPVAVFRRRKDADAEARRRRAIGPPDPCMVVEMEAAVVGLSPEEKWSVIRRYDARWRRSYE